MVRLTATAQTYTFPDMKLRLALYLSLLSATFSLVACGENAVLETGGGSGDIPPDPAAVALVAPFAGVYDLPDNWSGNPPDQAFLEIQQPNEQGIALANLYDQDDINNCIPSRPSRGEVTKAPVDDRVFMDNILAFNQAELSLQGSTLTILFQDVADLDNDGIRNEDLTFQAQRIDVMVIDLGPSC